ncbi:MAG: hybrid sensor histidine kinase/response regulator [Verrucomicrobia bacterium]|nr:hybrid sensor histidine kinase/response regulator [Verrucomicrobiota bacterium]
MSSQKPFPTKLPQRPRPPSAEGAIAHDHADAEAPDAPTLLSGDVKDYAIFTLDPAGRIATWNASAERLLGFSADEAIGQPFTLIFPFSADNPGKLAETLRRAKEAGGATGDGWHVRKDGSRFWASGMLAGLQGASGRLQGFVKVVRDETERMKTAEALKRARIEAESANLERDHFLATVSHELRTPLTATLLWAKLLNSPENAVSPQVREGLQAIEQSAREQQALIEELLDTSRIVAGKLRLNLAEVAVVPLVRTVLETIRPMAVEQEIVLVDSLDPDAGAVQADPLRLQQVLNNLLSNAVKFTPRHGQITVQLKRIRDVVEIQVSDTGQGISAEFLPRIFDRFVQADSSTGPKAGLGLGLSIARQLVALHGGDLTVESAGLAKGATFTVRLPLPKITPSHRSPAPTKRPSLHGLKILMVEDDLDTRKALAATLSRAGAIVVPAESGAAALREFAASRPDVILSDIGLGEMSGHEMIGHIRNSEDVGARPVPAIALTAYTDEKNIAQALKSGFQEVLSKPVESGLLLRTLAAFSPK